MTHGHTAKDMHDLYNKLLSHSNLCPVTSGKSLSMLIAFSPLVNQNKTKQKHCKGSSTSDTLDTKRKLTC